MSAIKEVPHNVPMHRPVMLCDNELDPGRKQLPSPLPNHSHTMAIIGRPGSGKSSFVYAMLAGKKRHLYNRLFDAVHYACPPGSLASVKGGLKNHKRVYNDLSMETMTTIMEELEDVAGKGPKHNSLVVLDDLASSLSGEALSDLKRLFFNRRHLHASCWVISQTWRGSVPYELRRTLGYLAFWKPASQTEAQAVYEEVLAGFLTKPQWEQVQHHVFHRKHGKHTFLFVDIIGGRCYRCTGDTFFELVLDDSDDNKNVVEA